MQIGFMALEDRVTDHFEDHIQIARRTAIRTRLTFLRESKLGSRIDSCRDIHLQFALSPKVALAPAFLAGPVVTGPGRRTASKSAARRETPVDRLLRRGRGRPDMS